MHRLVLLAVCAAGCSKPSAVEVPSWSPGVMFRTPAEVNARGFLDRRGLIHAHSYYSHDACDGQPHDANGVLNQPCYDDFRAGLCTVGHDFVFLTDHNESFGDNEFPDVLLYREDLGDALIDHGTGPSANRLSCPGGQRPLVMAGAETDPMMPVGLEHHAEGRRDTYGADGADPLLKVKAAGAVALVAHTEGWTVDQLTSLPLDGFEMYNLHANTFRNLPTVADLVLGKIEKGNFEGLPHPDAFLLYFALEDPVYLEHWGTVFSRGVKRVTTMGTDCHRNSLPQLMSDGERVDSYRRMMMGFSNHLLVRPQADGSIDDRDLKAALREGRLYGVFEFMGYAAGFDFNATDDNGTHEMGEEVRVGATLNVAMPSVLNLAKDADKPQLTAKLLKAKDGGWDEVASGDGALSFVTTEPGAYRAEIRMVPTHLKPYAGKRLDLLKTDRPWVYSNVIYVKP